jgi:hypothetical protein
MAKLTDQLPTDLSVKPVREPPAPSAGAATLFSNIGNAVDTYQRVQRRNEDEARVRSAAERQAREDARKDQERGLAYEVVKRVQGAYETANKVFADSQTDEGQLKALEDNFDVTFGRLSAQEAAARQGKLPDIAFRASLNKEYLALINANPDHVDFINAKFREHKFNPSQALQAAEDAQSQHEAEREAGEKFQDDMFKAGAATLSAEQMNAMSRDDVIVHGINATRAEYEIKLATERANLTLQNKNIAAADRTLAQETLDDNVSQTLLVNSLNDFNPIRTSLQQAMVAIGKAPVPEQQALFESYGVKLDQMIGNYRAQMIARAAAARMSPEKIASLTSNFDNQITSIRGMWTGELSVAKSNQASLDALTRASELNAAQTMPVFFALKAAGLNPTSITAFAEGVAANANLQEALRKEMQGYSVEFGEERASTRLMNIVRILKGELSLENYSPEKARQELPTLFNTARSMARAYRVDPKTTDGGQMLNAVGSVITAARTLSASSGLQAWMNATAGVAGRDVRPALIQALKDPLHNDMAEATIQGARAASAQLLDSMRKDMLSTTMNGYTIKLENGRAVIKDVSGRQGANAQAYPVPEAIRNYTNIWNANLDNIIALNPHDPTGVKNATPTDIAKFYGQGIVTEPFKNRPDINPKAEIEKQFEALEKTFDAVPSMNTDVSFEDHLINEESAGDPTARNQRSSATGLGQFIRSTWLDLVKRHAPGQAEGKSDQEILALRTNPELSRRMIRAYSTENAQVLRNKGIEVTNTNLNLMHLFGAGEGPKVLKAHPQTPVEQLVSAQTIRANPWMRGKTVNDIIRIRTS